MREHTQIKIWMRWIEYAFAETQSKRENETPFVLVHSELVPFGAKPKQSSRKVKGKMCVCIAYVGIESRTTEQGKQTTTTTKRSTIYCLRLGCVVAHKSGRKSFVQRFLFRVLQRIRGFSSHLNLVNTFGIRESWSRKQKRGGTRERGREREWKWDQKGNWHRLNTKIRWYSPLVDVCF